MSQEAFTINPPPIPKVTECPRDAQQGLPYTITPSKRTQYINELMSCGFDIIDFGSFVSPKAVPQMSDSNEVLAGIDKTNSTTQLLAIIGNARGAKEAAGLEHLDILGFPFSISNTFLEKNIHSNSMAVTQILDEITTIGQANGKALRVYISMAFGNPYGDEWSIDIVNDAVETLIKKGVQSIILSDTTGLATPETIDRLFSEMGPRYPTTELGLHLHTQPADALSKIDAAWKAGCRSFDAVINGFGGCPLTGYELLGNLNTLTLLAYFEQQKIPLSLHSERIREIAGAYPGFEALSPNNIPTHE